MSEGTISNATAVHTPGTTVVRQGRARCECGFFTRLLIIAADVSTVPCPDCGAPLTLGCED